MSFESIMAMVVGRAITEEQELSGPWNEYTKTKDRRVLQAACGYGRSIPDTKCGAYYYSLVYQKQHYDVLAAVMALGDVALPLHGRCLMVDFGAGPGTAALAWAAHVVGRTNASPALSYVHMDHLAAMEPLCDALLKADRNLGSELQRWSYRKAPTSAAYNQEWVKDADYAVFVFSYVLCQVTVGPSTVADFVRLIVETCEALSGKPAYILMVDAPLHQNSSWPLLLRGLRQRGMTATPKNPSPELQYRAVYLNPDGTVRDSRDNAGPAVYNVVRLQ